MSVCCRSAPKRGLLQTQESWRRGTEATLLDRWPAVCSLGRLLILTWLITWISTVPLFHIHIPDTTDRWSALQSGGVHTVLTPDLPGEYALPSHDSHRESSAQIGTRVINSPELGFILIGEQAKNVDAIAILDSLSLFRAPPLLHQFTLALAASRAPPRFIYA